MSSSRTFGLGLAALAVAAAGAIACGSAGDSKDAASPSFAPTLAPEKSAASKPAAGKPTAAAPPAVTGKPVAAAATIEDGTWVVGEDIPAGTYKVNQPVESGCYWAITKSGTNGGTIIQNDLVSGGRPKVTIKKGHDFETARCGVWTKIG